MISEYIDFARTRLTETEAESLDRLANALPKYFKDPSLKAAREQAWHAAFIRSQVALNQMLAAPQPTLASCTLQPSTLTANHQPPTTPTTNYQ